MQCNVIFWNKRVNVIFSGIVIQEQWSKYASDTFVAQRSNIAYLTPSLPQGTALIRILPEGTELKELIRILPQGIALKLLVLFSIVFYLKYIYVGFCKQFILRKGIHYTN